MLATQSFRVNIPRTARFLPLLLALIAFTGAAPAAKTILFLGDSITAGYGLEVSEAYPALIQAKIDEIGRASCRERV